MPGRKVEAGGSPALCRNCNRRRLTTAGESQDADHDDSSEGPSRAKEGERMLNGTGIALLR
jgi:hypothetical protein